jgi:hypothetical protein
MINLCIDVICKKEESDESVKRLHDDNLLPTNVYYIFKARNDFKNN